MSGLPTRSNIMEHLLVSVLNAGDPQAPYRRAFQTAGATSIEDVLELTKDDLKSLSWKDQSGDICHLTIGAVNTILSIGGWFASQETTDESVFLSLTHEALASWRRAQASAAPAINAKPIPPTPVKSGSTIFGSTSGPALSAADEFKKGIKRDIFGLSEVL